LYPLYSAHPTLSSSSFNCPTTTEIYTLSLHDALPIFDEFTSVVDRTVAQIGSAAVAKTIRRSGKQLVAASCHYDVIEWLQPDWIDRKSTRLNSSHVAISYAVFCLKKKNRNSNCRVTTV